MKLVFWTWHKISLFNVDKALNRQNIFSQMLPFLVVKNKPELLPKKERTCNGIKLKIHGLREFKQTFRKSHLVQHLILLFTHI